MTQSDDLSIRTGNFCRINVPARARAYHKISIRGSTILHTFLDTESIKISRERRRNWYLDRNAKWLQLLSTDKAPFECTTRVFRLPVTWVAIYSLLVSRSTHKGACRWWSRLIEAQNCSNATRLVAVKIASCTKRAQNSFSKRSIHTRNYLASSDWRNS